MAGMLPVRGFLAARAPYPLRNQPQKKIQSPLSKIAKGNGASFLRSPLEGSYQKQIDQVALGFRCFKNLPACFKFGKQLAFHFGRKIIVSTKRVEYRLQSGVEFPEFLAMNVYRNEVLDDHRLSV